MVAQYMAEVPVKKKCFIPPNKKLIGDILFSCALLGEARNNMRSEN
jgi:hypothetical protein